MKRNDWNPSHLVKHSLLLVCLSYGHLAIAQDRLNLEQFRLLISTKALKIAAANDSEAGATLEASQSRYITAPQAFIDYQDSKDKSPTLTPEFSGTERNGDELKVGIQAQTSLGIKPRVYSFVQNQKVSNISSLPNPDLSLQRKGYGVEAEVSLWKNAFGKDIRSQQQTLGALSEAKRFQAIASRVGFEVESDLLYFQTAYLVEAVEIQKSLVKQGEKLVSWTQEKSNARLLEPVHVAQAQAAHQSRKIALISYQQQLHANLLKISQLVGINVTASTLFDSTEQLAKSIQSPGINLSEKITIPALAKSVEAERAQLQLTNESLKPDLNLKAQYLAFSDTGKQDDSSRCKSASDCRSMALSLNLTIPLDISAWQKGAKAVSARVSSLEKDLQAENQNSQVEKEQLLTQLSTLKEQIISYEKLVQSQETRLSKERERQARGRATTYDLIISEQDLGESRIALSEAKTNYLSTITQLRFFQEAK